MDSDNNSKAKARAQLKEIFESLSAGSDWTVGYYWDYFQLQMSLGILRAFPRLASETFPLLCQDRFGVVDVHPKFPLYFFAGYGLSLQAVEEVYWMYPDALAPQDSDGTRFGYKTHVTELLKLGKIRSDVVSFLLQQFASATTYPTPPDWTLAHRLLVRLPRSPIKDPAVLRKCNEALSFMITSDKSTCNQRLCSMALSSGVITEKTVGLIADNLPLQFKELYFCPCGRNRNVTLDDAKKIVRILPRLQKLTFSPGSRCPVDPAAFYHLISSIRKSCGGKLQSLHLRTTPQILSPTSHLLGDVIASETLREFTLDFTPYSGCTPYNGPEHKALERLAEIILQRKTPLDKLHLEGFRLRREAVLLVSMLMSGTTVRHIVLRDAQIDDWYNCPISSSHWNNPVSPRNDNHQCLESFTVEASAIRSAKRLLKELAKVASLRAIKVSPGVTASFELDASSSRDYTEPIINLLSALPLLEELRLCPRKIDLRVEPLAQVLKGHPNLRVLQVGLGCSALEPTDPTLNDTTRYQCIVDLLQAGNNTTLEVCDILRYKSHATSPEGVKLKYLVNLNLLGRGVARDPATSQEMLVDVLLRANAEPRSHVYLYGLLRENPSLWCGCAQPDDAQQTRRHSYTPRYRFD